MNRRKNLIWANVLVGGLFLAALGGCSNDEPAATTGTPAPSNASSTDAAPIAGSSTASSPAASPDAKDSKDKDKDKKGDGDKSKTDTDKPAAPKPNAPTKPLVAGEVKPDKPLPAEDVKAKPEPEKPKALVQGGLSESQINTMKAQLDDAKKDLAAGKVEDAKNKFNEFAGDGGPWSIASKDLKPKSAEKNSAIEAAIKAVDAAGNDKEKLTKALNDLSTAIDKAK
jgi:hypothetical protein